jgi:hypothetical protein
MTSPRYTADRARRLALIRQLFLRAEEDADRPEPLCAQAVLTLHDAAELFLVLIADSTSANVKASANFLDYWAPVNVALAPDQLGHKLAMKAVSDARRGLKHSGVLPSRSEVQRFARSTREFLEEATRLVFGTDFNRASLVDLVPVEKVRVHLKTAEEALGEQNTGAALREAALAFELATFADPPADYRSLAYRRWEKRVQEPDFRRSSSWDLGLEHKVGRDFARKWDTLCKTAEHTAKAVRLLSRGVEFDDYLSFELMTPSVSWFVGSQEPDAGEYVKEGVTFDDAVWCVDFATRSALRLLAS